MDVAPNILDLLRYRLERYDFLMAEASLENGPKMPSCIVSFPWQSEAPYKFLSELLKILDPLCKEIVVIDGNTGPGQCSV